MDHQVFYFIFGLVLSGAIQAAWIDRDNRGGAVKHRYKRQIEGGCFYNICNETDNYPADEIRQLVEKTPGYKKLFGTVLKPHRKISLASRSFQEDERDEEQETNMCGIKTYYTKPKSAIDIFGEKHIVVNGDGMEQLIEYETCDTDASCIAKGHIPGYTVSCRVQEVIVRFFVYTKTSSGEPVLQLKSFAIPSGCYRAAKYDNFRTGRLHFYN